MNDAMNVLRRWLLVLCLFVAPLVFFTNLTRNPYVTQIAIVHAGAALALAAWAWTASGREGGWRLPRLAAAAPLALFAAAWGASWLRSYLVHPAFFRPALAAEGSRATLFLVAVCLSTFALSAAVSFEDDGTADVPLGAWVAFAVVWGLAWSGFAAARSRAIGRPEDFWSFLWDPYGAFLWAAGAAAAFRLTRRGRAADYLHLALCAGFLASAYGILQYFNWDWVWPYTLNPYGGRAVSTFGNPNFLSSYNVALMPCALGLFLTEKDSGRRLAYAAVFLTLEAAMLATLTRSSWVGGGVACAALALSPRLRARGRASPRPLGLLLGGAAALVFLWPSSSIATGYAPNVVGRLTEISSLMKRDDYYSPFHQRVLIWTCAWLMGSESPLLGKGSGAFELFYPFYQGTLLHASTFWHHMRTHANNSHNEVLEVFAQTGLVGLGAYLAFFAAFFETVRRGLKTRLGEDPLWLGAAAGCAGVLVDNLLNVSLHFAVPAFLFWWLAGSVLGRASRDEGGRVEWTAPPALRRGAAAAVAAFALAVCWTQVRFWEREVWYFAGFKLARMGDIPAAARALERSRAWGPREVNALYELGNAYARMARPQDAAAAYREALDANAGYDEIYYNLATVYNAHLGQPETALKFYQTSWAINPLSNDLANALSAMDLRGPSPRVDDAVAVLSEAVRDFPDNPNHWNNLGYAYSLRKDWTRAEEAYTRALAIAPDLALAERNLAGLAAQSGRPRAAILGVIGDLRAVDAAVARRDFSDRTVALSGSAAKRAPKLAKARFTYGSLLLSRGRVADAIPELEAAAAIDPSRAPAQLNLGVAYQAAGRAADAEARYRAALALEPGNQGAIDRLKSLGRAP
ncbi:MAG: tetratricopeptide repeat protein [Elusimicrobia bacterium]|nr:tetratricopeptide repeat protein [Elusimicrobiota bacterium]